MRHAIAGTVVLLAPWVLACPRARGPNATEPPPCDPSSQQCVYSGALSTLTLEPHQETDDLCQSWALDNAQELLVTEVTMNNDGGYHHSNWFFVPNGAYDAPEGTWKCSQYGFEEFEAAVQGGFLFAQSTQSRHEVQRFPTGAAVRIPPYSVIIGNTHVHNMTEERITTNMRLRLQTAPRDRVSTLLVPARFSYYDLEILPRARATFTAECDLSGPYREVMGEPLEYVLHYVLPHYHGLGVVAEMAVAGGPHDGLVLHRHEGFGTNFGRAFEPPVDLAALGATGLRFTCAYDNTTEETIEWGIHGDEMCVFALFADTRMAWDAEVPEDRGHVVRTTKDGVTMHTGPCEITTVPWTAEKPGGQPRTPNGRSRSSR